MSLPRFNVYSFLTVVISLLAVLMVGLVFLLLPGPDEFIRRMQARMIRERSFTVVLEVAYDGVRSYRDGNYTLQHDKEAFMFRTNGKFDRRDAEDVRTRQEFSLLLGAEDIADGKPSASGTSVRVGGRDYVRFATLPAQVGAVRTAELVGKWLRYDLDRLRESIDAPLFGSSGRAFTPDEQEELLRRVAASAFLSHLRTLADERMGDVLTTHYETMPEPLFFKDFFVREESLRLGRPLAEKELRSVDVLFGNVAPLTSHVWIGKRDYRLYKIVLRFGVDEDGREGVVTVTATFGGFGANGSGIAQPEGQVTDIDDILAKLLPGVAEHLPLAQDGSVRVMEARKEEAHIGLPVDVKDSGRDDADGDGLTDDMEYFFGTDRMNADTDGDGMDDGAEVDEGRNPKGGGNLFDFGQPGA